MTTINVRRVSVTVDAGGTVACTPDPISISGRNLCVAFSLDTPGYNFPDSGAIVVTSGGAEFPYASWTLRPNLAGLYDADTAAGDFQYTVNVVNSSTGGTLSVDPGIKNSGQ
jgi:hypothetical protein